MLAALGIVLAAYLVGALPFGYLIARSRGVDILRAGSGNIGATNVGRVLGRAVARLGLAKEPFASGQYPLTLFCLAGAALVVARHRSNLVRLWRGQENRLRETPTMRHLAATLHVLALAVWCGSAVWFTF